MLYLARSSVQARAIPKRHAQSRPEVAPQVEAPCPEGVSLEQTWSQLPMDLSVEQHHEETIKVVEEG